MRPCRCVHVWLHACRRTHVRRLRRTYTAQQPTRGGCGLQPRLEHCAHTLRTWQSMRSVMPPCPGMLSPKSLILNPRLKPLAKNPPKGAISDANRARLTCGGRAGRQAGEQPSRQVGRQSGSHVRGCQTLRSGQCAAQTETGWPVEQADGCQRKEGALLLRAHATREEEEG